MLQYIISTSIIWLTSIALYECWLRKESFHHYNRMYLASTLIAGLVIPSIHFTGFSEGSKTTFMQPISQAIKVKEASQLPEMIGIAVTNSTVYDNMAQIVGYIYFLGLFGGLLYFAWELISLLRLYRQGKKSQEFGCTIVETGQIHAAYSFFSIIFVKSKKDYSPEEWTFLFAHEKEHHRQWHVIDNLFLIALRTVGWFHPLTHIYFNKLRMVHEFQADSAAASDTAKYGIFLLEQNLLQGAPILTHSFNYSPLKIRINMLLKTKSTRKNLLKYLSIFPLFFFFIICCTQTSFSGGINKKEKTVIFNNNEIQFEDFKLIPYAYQDIMRQQKKMFLNVVMPDSIPIKDRTSGFTTMQKVESASAPAKLNGKPIFGKEEDYLLNDYDSKYADPVFMGDAKILQTYIFQQLKKEFEKLDDGEYYLRGQNMVIDDKGNMAFYENVGIDNYTPIGDRKPENAADLITSIEEKMVSILNDGALFKPAHKNGKPVQTRFRFGNFQILVKNHQARFIEGGGC